MHDPDLPHSDDHAPAWLDHALARHLGAPQAPATLRTRLTLARQQESLAAMQARQAELEAQLAQARARLRQGQWRLGGQTLALVVAVSFALGALAVALLPQLTDASGLEAATLMPALALLLGAASGLVVALRRWGWLQRWF
jgi:hypothetical protein